MNSPRNCQCSAASTTTGKRWAAEVFTALGEQTVVVSGTGAVGIVLPQLAAQLVQLRTSRAQVLGPRPVLTTTGNVPRANATTKP